MPSASRWPLVSIPSNEFAVAYTRTSSSLMRRCSHNRGSSCDIAASGSLAAVGRLFGTDGVRGLAGTDLTRDLAFGLGRAAVVVLGRHGAGRPTFLIGRDTRALGRVAGGGARRTASARPAATSILAGRRAHAGDRVPHDRSSGHRRAW